MKHNDVPQRTAISEQGLLEMCQDTLGRVSGMTVRDAINTLASAGFTRSDGWHDPCDAEYLYKGVSEMDGISVSLFYDSGLSASKLEHGQDPLDVPVTGSVARHAYVTDSRPKGFSVEVKRGRRIGSPVWQSGKIVRMEHAQVF